MYLFLFFTEQVMLLTYIREVPGSNPAGTRTILTGVFRGIPQSLQAYVK
jgi:hypothetical protein